MQNFQDTFETRKRSFICAFSICMTVPLRKPNKVTLECKNLQKQQSFYIERANSLYRVSYKKVYPT